MISKNYLFKILMQNVQENSVEFCIKQNTSEVNKKLKTILISQFSIYMYIQLYINTTSSFNPHINPLKNSTPEKSEVIIKT